MLAVKIGRARDGILSLMAEVFPMILGGRFSGDFLIEYEGMMPKLRFSRRQVITNSASIEALGSKAFSISCYFAKDLCTSL